MGDILFLAHRVPYPPDRGDKIRSFNILKKLCAMATVHLATFADDDADLQHAEALRPMLGSLHIEKRAVSKPVGAMKALTSGKPISLTMFDSSGVRAFVCQTLAQKPVETIFVFSGQMAQFVPDLPSNIRFVMDFVDMDSAKFAEYAQTASGPMNLVHAREGRKLFAFERNIAERADYSLFVSTAETALFREQTGLESSKIRTLENGIDCDFFNPENSIPTAEIGASGPLLVFTGQMDYRPNIEAVTSFARETLPAIRAERPDVRFAIVGRNPDNDVRKLVGHEGIIVTGGVPDIRSWLVAADTIVAPLRMARGIQNKVLEAMAMEKPAVVSRQAFEGIDAVQGRDLLVASDIAAEAQAVLELLDDPASAKTMGRAARARMLARYGWDSTLAPLADVIGHPEKKVPETSAKAAA